MHELKSTPKRYQNPEVFEQLAIEYAVGSLQGRARDRFEVLMDTHFYLRATVDAYEAKFAHLVELLPDKTPADKVWNNIEAHVKQTSKETSSISSATEKTSWWQTSFFKQGFSIAMMALIVTAVMLFNPMTDHQPGAIASYTAVMESNTSGEPMAVTKIKKSDMMISVDVMKPMTLEDGMELTLWCQPKSGGKPMKMGTISNSGKTEIAITKDQWNDMDHISGLAVSVEKKGNANIKEPSSEIVLKGKLSSAE